MRRSEFKIVALISAFNEGDIISRVLEHLIANGVLAYLIDNRSTDDTVEQAKAWLGRGLIGIESLPRDRDALGEIPKRKEALAATLGADWFIDHDADEMREAPFPGMSLKEAIRWVDDLGYNCIDFRTLEFRPTDDHFRQGHDPKLHFQYMEEGLSVDRAPWKCWKAGSAPVALSESGGSDVGSEGRRVFPVRFILRHYPVRRASHQSVSRRDTLTRFDLDRVRFELLLPSGIAREALDRAHATETRLRQALADSDRRISSALSHAQRRLGEENTARLASEADLRKMEVRSVEDRLVAANARAELGVALESLEQERTRHALEVERRERIEQRFTDLEHQHVSLQRDLQETQARLRAVSESLAETPLARLRTRVQGLRVARDRRLVAASPLFDRDWYLDTYPDVAAGGADPAGHYVRFGAAEGRDPGPAFSGRAYFEANQDVARTRVNPLVHFERFGRAEGRPLSPPRPELSMAPVDPLVLVSDAPREPTPFPAVDDGSREAAERSEAWRALRRDRHIVNASPFFDRAGYVARNPDVAKSGLDAADHYLRFGAAEGRDPGPDFGTRAYLAANPDVAREGMNPLVHYERFGRVEERPLGVRPVSSPEALASPGWVEDEEGSDPPGSQGTELPDAEVERLFLEGEGVVIEGWALWPTRRLPQVVRVLHDDALVGRARVKLSRPDVRSHYPEIPGAIHSGFRVFASLRVAALRSAPLALTLEFSDADGRTLRRQARVELQPSRDKGSAAFAPLVQALESVRALLGRDPAVLDWNTGLNLDAVLTRAQVFSPPPGRSDGDLPYLDHSIDIVVAPEARLEEARRAASVAVFAVDGSTGHVVEAWRAPLRARDLPTASIVIPAFNHSATTDACLGAVTDTLPADFRGEILVIDDASTDDTPEMLARWVSRDARVRVIRNASNLGFLDSCNRAAEDATGEILVFLNNDTLPRPGWLPPLLRTLAEAPGAGAVGGKLLYPDGTLQEAGGIIFNDASGCNVGRGDPSPDRPAYNMLREVDYCSGALLATPRDLFLSLGGFDPRYRPAYYEDTDYCFTLWDRGYRVFYQPQSEIVHLEGVTSGTDLSAGVKSYQVVNRVRFTEKWQAALAFQMEPRRIDVGSIHSRTTGRRAR